MYQEVFRNTEYPPFDWRTAEFQKMRLMFANNSIETEDPLLIHVVLTILQAASLQLKTLQPDGIYPNAKNYSLLLFSDQLPGLMYSIGVHIDSDGLVYLAENPISNEWHGAGSFFLEWMNQ